VASPGVPAERVAALRLAFEATMKNPDFLADAAKSHIEVHPIAWQDLESLVRKVLSAPKSAIDLLKSALAAGPRPATR
jgi:tripartite-type tricarboxylate transporter receptor subunit TctC